MVFLNKQYHLCDDFCRDFNSIYLFEASYLGAINGSEH